MEVSRTYLHEIVIIILYGKLLVEMMEEEREKRIMEFISKTNIIIKRKKINKIMLNVLPYEKCNQF